MVAHRKNTAPPKAYVPSSWFIVLTVMIVVGGAGWLGWLLVDDGASDVSASPSGSTSAPDATPDPTPSGQTTEPDPTPSASDTPEPTDPAPSAPAAARDTPVSVLNNSGIVGAARTFSAKVTAAGWTLGGIGNWTGAIGANTVYYPDGLQAQAELLAADVGIERVRPRVSPMRPDRLTIILSGPQ